MKEFVVTMLVLETGMLGVFVSLDVFLFYVFWEAMLIPMYLIIGVWGGSQRVYAAVKFVLYTLVGSLLMLVAILALYVQHGGATGLYTFDLPALTRWVMPTGLGQNLMFLAFALAFAIKVPLFPFHTWLPDAHVEAPDTRQRHPGRGPPQDGNLRIPALLPAPISRRQLDLRAARVRPGRDRHHLWRLCLHRPA